VTAGVIARVAPRSTTGKGEAIVYSGPNAVVATADEWRAVSSGCPTVFQTWTVAKAAAVAHVGHGQEPHVVVVREEGQAVAVLPLVTTNLARHRVLRFLGDPLIQYGDALLSTQRHDGYLATALSAARLIEADAILFRKVREDANLAGLLHANASLVQTEHACAVDLKSAYSLPAKDDRELRRLRRRLAEVGETRFSVTCDGTALPDLQLALELKRQWLLTRGADSAVVGDSYWERALLSLASSEDALLAVARLNVGEEAAAFEVAMFRGSQWIAFLGAINPAFARYGPGQIQMAETIAFARAKGFATYDLLAPAHAFKRVIANREYTVRDYAIAVSARGQLLTRAFAFMPTAKRFLNATPKPLRSVLQAVLRLR
jgi:CelD/BcsL family acetyltransferase involved in cellulose biosynthesis